MHSIMRFSTWQPLNIRNIEKQFLSLGKFFENLQVFYFRLLNLILSLIHLLIKFLFR